MPETILTTPLDTWHREHGARMVPFAGYSMPVQYDFAGAMAERCKGGVMAEHLYCREKAALFDVSHMGQAMLHGAGAAGLLEHLVCGDISGLRPGRQRYTLLTTESGGILDDLMVANLGEEGLFLVVNASRKAVDFAHIGTVTPVTVLTDRALLALQGPAAAGIMARLAPAAAALPFMGVARCDIAGVPGLVSRSGYTGEDGFEMSVPGEMAVTLANRLLEQPDLIPAGLGARDSLRLEAGLCLYGNDIGETTSPIEAGLTWAISKRRKMSWDFLGGPAIRAHLDNGPPRRRVGIRPDGRAPAREHTVILTPDGQELIGEITSGGFGPTLNGPMAMGYVRNDFSDDGSKLSLMVRGKPLPATVVPLPFVPHRYVR
ncbi:MAG: glycine cleavage system aminomethyltransferase GcvT [Acetobacteraceae bacterium]|nr:glycine cleavage system aminomethyltransferase GcvT [Acetobacteraceae bacterium]